MLPGIRAELESLRQRHSAALELMGERDEEVLAFLVRILSHAANKILYTRMYDEAYRYDFDVWYH